MQVKKNALLLVFPVLTFVLSIIVVTERQPYYACWSDPPYCYLYNGLNIASGNFKVGQVDHPGTPLQLFSAASIRLFFLFSDDKDVVHDVLSRPEWYLFRVGILQSAVVALCMFIASWLTYRFTANMFYSVFIQFTHLVSFHALFFSQNLMTEFVLTCTGILLAPFLIKYVLTSKEEGSRIIFPAGIIAGIMLAGKISSFPVFILWLLVMKSKRHLFFFTASVIASFCVFTIPAWHAAGEFFGFITKITTHTGKYGAGEKGMVLWPEFFANLKVLLLDSYLFTLFCFALTLLTVRALLTFIKTKTMQPHQRVFVATWLVTAMQLFIVSKHFGKHYIMPAYLLIIPAGIILLMVKNYVFVKAKWAMVVLFTAGFAWVAKSAVQYDFFPGLQQPGRQTAQAIKKQKFDLTIFDCNVTAPLPQVALLFGVGYSGNMANHYKAYLKNIYPPFFWENDGNGMMRNFTGEYKPADVLPDSISVLYYSDNPNFEIKNKQWDDGKITIDTVLFSYKNATSGETMHIIKLKKSN